MASALAFAQRPHYLLLDALRGVAALLVVGFHLTEFMNPGTWPLYHGYIAVDFFFGLSGFVIAYAYDGRWQEGLTIGGFLQRRVIRLQPLVFLGVALGTMLYYFSSSPMYSGVATTPVLLLVLTSLLNAFMVPTPAAWSVRGFGEVTSVNAPIWSLMYEYVANVLYALFVRRLSTRWLAVFVAVCGLWLLDSSMGFNLWGNLPVGEGYLSVNYGYVFNPQHVYVALARVCYPFFMGTLIARLLRHDTPDTPQPTWWGRNAVWLAAVLLSMLLLAPRMGEVGSWTEGLYNSLVILVAFPLILVIGAKGQALGRRTKAISQWLGDISFPLYITHYPIVYLYLAWWDRDRSVSELQPATWWFVMASTFVLCLIVAQVALKSYDLPVRRWLQQHWH